MACKFAKNFIFFPSIDGLVLCMYLCMYNAGVDPPAGRVGMAGVQHLLIPTCLCSCSLLPAPVRPPNSTHLVNV